MSQLSGQDVIANFKCLIGIPAVTKMNFTTTRLPIVGG
jgi:hypothetical protein